MQAFEIIGGILLILMAIAIIIMVLMQEGKGGGASALGGAQPQSYGKNRAHPTFLLCSCRSSAPELRQEQSKNVGCAPFQIYESDRRGFSCYNFSGLDFKYLFLIMSKSPAVGRAFLLHAFALWNLS